MVKKNIKRIVIIASTALSLLFSIGCKGGAEKTDSSSEAAVAEITFSETQKDMTIGDEFYLTPDYTRKDGFTLSYVSENPSVVSVDENGKVTALLEGASVVSAVYTDGTVTEKAEMTVTSAFNGNVPQLVLKRANADGTLSLTPEGDYQLSVEVSFNGKTYTDVDLEYSSEDSDIASVDVNGLISPRTLGATNIVVKGSWRGVDYTEKKTLILTVPVTIKSDVVVLNDGKVVSDTSLYTLSYFAGETYATRIPNKFTIVIDGVTYPATVSVENEKIARVSSDGVKAKAYGSTTLTISGEGGGVSVTKAITLTVKRPTKVVEEQVPYYCTFLGTWYDDSDGGRKLLSERVSFNGAIVDAWQGNTQLTMKDGKILGITSSERDKKGEAQITVGTATALYEISLETYGNVISTKEDLSYLTQKSSNCYWELLNNVDATGYVLSYANRAVTFSGIFDGKGYTVKNLTIKENDGLFGKVSETTAIKNLGLDNLTATRAFYVSHDSPENGLTISNLYVRLSENTQNPRGLISYAGGGNTLKNIFIEYTGENATTNRVYADRDYNSGSFIGDLPITQPVTTDKGKARDFVFDTTFDRLWSDIYVVSPFVLSFNTSQVGDTNYSDTDVDVVSAVYGYGANATTDIYGNTIASKKPDSDEYYVNRGVHVRPEGTVLPGEYGKEVSDTYYNVQFTAVNQYADKEAMVASDVSKSFDTEYWSVENGYPVWKTAK